jgi:hypothetical protein
MDCPASQGGRRWSLVLGRPPLGIHAGYVFLFVAFIEPLHDFAIEYKCQTTKFLLEGFRRVVIRVRLSMRLQHELSLGWNDLRGLRKIVPHDAGALFNE